LASPELVIKDFGYNAGWRSVRHARLVADTTGDGRNDIVGFADDGMWVARGQTDGSFVRPRLVLWAFDWNHGWKVGNQPRCVVDTNGDGRNDIVGFGNDGVWVSRGQGDGSFGAPQLATKDFSYNAGWDSDRHPRFVADVTGDRWPTSWASTTRASWSRAARRTAGSPRRGPRVDRCTTSLVASAWPQVQRPSD
jgi:hypothetical protein